MKRYTVLAPLCAALALITIGCQEAKEATVVQVPTPPEDPPERDVQDPTPQLRRLTQLEFTRSLQHALGPVVLEGLEPDLSRAGLARVGAREVTTSLSGVERYNLLIEEAVEAVFSNERRRSALLNCDVSQHGQQICVDAFIAALGQRAWRRPLTASETERYQGLHSTCLASTGNYNESMRCLTLGLLQSPYFLYRIEVADDDGLYRDYAMASRLSYFLWSAPPDTELLRAATAGELNNAEGVRSQATRMMADPKARQGLATFVDEWFRLDQLDRLERDILAASDENVQFALGREGKLQPWLQWMAFAAREELRRMVVGHVFDDDADYLDLLTTDKTYVDTHMKAFYELDDEEEPGAIGTEPDREDGEKIVADGPPDAMGFMPARHAPDSPRRGIMGTMAFLSQLGKQNETSPTRRGLYIMERILCMEIGAPPDEIDICERPDGVSRRASIEEHHLCASSCKGCHSQMDPLGFALDNFDTIGRYRQIDDWGFDLDTSVTWRYLSRDGGSDTAQFDSLRSMAETFRDLPEATDCVTRQIYRYATGHHESDEAVIAELTETFNAQGRRLKGFMIHFVGTEAFRKTPDTPDEGGAPTLRKVYAEVFAPRCAACHVGPALGGLDLTLDDGLLGRLTGPSATDTDMPCNTAGDTQRSYLWHKVHGTFNDVEGGGGEPMPPNQPLNDTERELLRQWILGGLQP